MITEQTMQELANRLVNTYINFDGAYGNQCWDLSAYLQNLWGLPVINTGGPGRWPGWAGNMVDAFPQSQAIAQAYELLPPTAIALPGDTLVWDDSNAEWYPATHVAVCIRDNRNGWLETLSQNSSAPRPDLPGYSTHSTGPIIRQTLPKRGLLGIIRPRTGLQAAGDITTHQEGTLSAAEVHEIKVWVQGEINRAIDQIWGTAEGTQKLIQGVPGAVLNAEVPRGGTMGGNTTLGAMVSWNDEHVIQTIAAVAADRGQAGASVAEISAAVKQAMSESVVKVNVQIGENNG